MVDTKGAVVGQINGLSVPRLATTCSVGQPDHRDATGWALVSCPISSARSRWVAPSTPKGSSSRGLPWSEVCIRPFHVAECRLVSSNRTSGRGRQRFLSRALRPSSPRYRACQFSSVSRYRLGQPNGQGRPSRRQREIEGYYEVCQAPGSEGDEGVLISKANVTHLMLNERVRQPC